MAVGRRSGVALGLTLLGAVLVAAAGSQVAAALQGEQAPAVDDDGLVARLDALEASLPDGIGVDEVVLDEDASFGEVVGDAAATRATLATLEPELRALFVDADEAGTPVGDAVADVARGWLDVWAGASHLASAEGHDLAFPLDAVDDVDVATDADVLRGAVEIGLRSVLSGHDRHLRGYGALRDLGIAEPDAQARLDVRALTAQELDLQLAPGIRQLLSEPTTQLVVPSERFASSVPGEEARARSMTITCVDRDAYASLTDLGGEDEPQSLEDTLGDLYDNGERTDCPDLPPNVEVRPGRP